MSIRTTFFETAQHYLQIVQQEKAEVNCCRAGVLVESGNFRSLIECITAIEKMNGSNAYSKAHLEEACGMVAVQAIIHGEMSCDELVDAMVVVFSQEMTFAQQLEMYSVLSKYTTARAKAFIQQYMPIIQGIKAHPESDSNPAGDQRVLRYYQKLLFEFAPYLPERERVSFLSEIKEYIRSDDHVGLAISSISEFVDPGMKELDKRMEAYQLQLDRKNELGFTSMRLREEMLDAFAVWAKEVSPEYKRELLGKFVETEGCYKQAKAVEMDFLRIHSLEEILAYAKDYLVEFEGQDPTNPTRFFTIARFLMTLYSTKMVSVKLQLSSHIMKRANIVRMAAECLSSPLGRPLNEASKQKLTELLTNTAQDVERAKVLLGVNNVNEGEDLAEAEEAAQIVEKHIKECGEYLSHIPARIQDILRPVIEQLMQTVKGLDTTDPVYIAVDEAVRYLQMGKVDEALQALLRLLRSISVDPAVPSLAVSDLMTVQVQIRKCGEYLSGVPVRIQEILHPVIEQLMQIVEGFDATDPVYIAVDEAVRYLQMGKVDEALQALLHRISIDPAVPSLAVSHPMDELMGRIGRLAQIVRES